MKPLLLPLLRQLADGRFHSGEGLAQSLGVSRATVWDVLREAESLDVHLFRIRGKGYRLEAPIDFLDAAAVTALLGPASMFRVEVLDSVESTNSLLLGRAMQGEAHGACVAAELQTRGRGRQGRPWRAGLAGALTVSVLWRFPCGIAGLSGLSLAAGLAVAEACGSLGVTEVKLKWPNDIVHSGRKLAGILVEVHGEMLGPSAAVIGIGVNYRLTTKVLEEIDQPVVDLAAIAERLPSRNTLLAELLHSLSAVLARFEAGGFASLAEEWQTRHAYQMKPVRLLLPDHSRIDGVAEGVAADGALRIRTATGPLYFSVGDISLRPA